MQQVDHPVGSARPNRPPPPSSAIAAPRRSIRLPDMSAGAKVVAPSTNQAASQLLSATAKQATAKPVPWSKQAPPADASTCPSSSDCGAPSAPVSETGEPLNLRERWMTSVRWQQLREFAKQPKVWLALATAIIVQLVLSWAFSPKPPEAQPDRPALQNRRIAAEAPAAEPAARIVAPPAVSTSPSPGAPDAGEPVAVPLGSVGDGSQRWPVDSDTASADGAHGAGTAPIRMAENVRPGNVAPQFDGQPRGVTAGATLDALVPLDTAESEAPGGNP